MAQTTRRVQSVTRCPSPSAGQTRSGVLEMRPALLLIDLQNDFLGSRHLEPTRGAVCAASAALLAAGRAAAIPIVHVWTTIGSDEERMPHWRDAGRRLCLSGSPGHATPMALEPCPGEFIVHKRFYSAFAAPRLEEFLRREGVDTVILAGVYVRGCIRTTALDAYQRGFMVWVGDEAVADDDPTHAAVTRRYLAARAARFLPVDAIRGALAEGGVAATDAPGSHSPSVLPTQLVDGRPHTVTGLGGTDHYCPRERSRLLWRVPTWRDEQIRLASSSARDAFVEWERWPVNRRRALLLEAAERLQGESEPLAQQLATEIGKPVRDARQEVAFAVDLLDAATRQTATSGGDSPSAGWYWRRRPLGVVGLVTPWNNPLAIPLGKIAPALLHGNTMVWKPAPAGAAIAIRILGLLLETGLPPGAVSLVQGDRTTAELLAAEDQVDAVTLTGAAAAGHALQVICASRRIPFQAELGGNNAALVWHDADLAAAARRIAQAGFGSAGQRCTANRRVVVEAACYDAFLASLLEATAALRWGDPLDEATEVGPVISAAALSRLTGCVARARACGATVLAPHAALPFAAGLQEAGFYFPPTLVCCDEETAEIVQAETFGPVVVVQKAHGWEHAISLCNGVQQGLVAALFSGSPACQARFLAEARAGLLKINVATTGAAADAPFGGWKASGVGPFEHGVADVEFYTRHQTVYDPAASTPKPP